jgi:hypothetical protein
MKKGFHSRVVIIRDLPQAQVIICANASWRKGCSREKQRRRY